MEGKGIPQLAAAAKKVTFSHQERSRELRRRGEKAAAGSKACIKEQKRRKGRKLKLLKKQ